jgi:hypothetical protein
MTDDELIRDAREMAGAMPSNHGAARLLRMLAIRLSNANAAADLAAGRPLDPAAAPPGIEPVARRLEQLAARLAAAERERDALLGLLIVPSIAKGTGYIVKNDLPCRYTGRHLTWESAVATVYRIAGLAAAPPAPAPPPAEPGSAEITVTCETPANFAANETLCCEWCCEPWGGAVNTDYPDEPRAACLMCGTLFLPIPVLIHATGGA